MAIPLGLAAMHQACRGAVDAFNQRQQQPNSDPHSHIIARQTMVNRVKQESWLGMSQTPRQNQYRLECSVRGA
jgi:hypothetical protein